MPVVNRSQIEPLHREVLAAWRQIVTGSRDLGMADRVVIAVQLERRAKALATHERLSDGSGDLADDAQTFATGTKDQSPVTKAFAIYSLVTAVLGFFGYKLLTFIGDLLPTAQTGAETTATGASAFLAVASGGVIVFLVRGAFLALQSVATALEEFSNKQHPSAVLLAEVAPAEKRLFGLFDREVPDTPISAGPLILLGVALCVLGGIFAFLVGVGAGSG